MFRCCCSVWAFVHTRRTWKAKDNGSDKAMLCRFKHHGTERQGRVENHRRVMTKRRYTSPFLLFFILLPSPIVQSPASRSDHVSNEALLHFYTHADMHRLKNACYCNSLLALTSLILYTDHRDNVNKSQCADSPVITPCAWHLWHIAHVVARMRVCVCALAGVRFRLHAAVCRLQANVNQTRLSVFF